MAYERKEVKMPKGIKTYSEFKEWLKSFDSDKTSVEIRMKRRSNFGPQQFWEYKDGKEVHYLINDSESYGYCRVENFNRVFDFVLETYY